MKAFWVVWSKPQQRSRLGRLLSLFHMSIIIISSKAFFFIFHFAERITRASLWVVAQIKGLNYPLCSVVNMLNRSWRDGTNFDCTESSNCGRTEHSMLAVIVTNLVASQKITGVASHSSKDFFCLICGLPKPKINNLDQTTWPTSTQAMQKKAAEEWRDTPTKK